MKTEKPEISDKELDKIIKDNLPEARKQPFSAGKDAQLIGSKTLAKNRKAGKVFKSNNNTFGSSPEISEAVEKILEITKDEMARHIQADEASYKHSMYQGVRGTNGFIQEPHRLIQEAIMFAAQEGIKLGEQRGIQKGRDEVLEEVERLLKRRAEGSPSYYVCLHYKDWQSIRKKFGGGKG